MGKPSIMGILNVTPDSFYDGGRFVKPEQALRQALAMAEEGADWLDVGGMSTRPGSVSPPMEEEIRRVVPVIAEIHRRLPAMSISIDTCRAVVARAALDAGATGINDVTALGDPHMAAVAAAAGCPVFLMHMRGSPATMQQAPVYADVVAEVAAYLAERAALARAAGVSPVRIYLDPGIGFGKDDTHNAALIRGLPALAALGYPVMIGVSRKSFIGRVLNLPDPQQRLEGSLALAALATWLGVDLLRVHDVQATRRVVEMVVAVRGSDPQMAPSRRWAEERSPC